MNEAGRIINNTSVPTNTNQTLKVRLDTQSIVMQIEMFLRGIKLIPKYNEQGSLYYEEVQIGKRKCNSDGVQTLLNWITATINPQVVQGNFMVDERSGDCKAYDDYIEEYNIELAKMVVINVYDWDMKDSDIDGVINFIMFLIIPFMSRLINNEERLSYNQTMKSVESSTTKEGGGLKFPLFNA